MHFNDPKTAVLDAKKALEHFEYMEMLPEEDTFLYHRDYLKKILLRDGPWEPKLKIWLQFVLEEIEISAFYLWALMCSDFNPDFGDWKRSATGYVKEHCSKTQWNLVSALLEDNTFLPNGKQFYRAFKRKRIQSSLKCTEVLKKTKLFQREDISVFENKTKEYSYPSIHSINCRLEAYSFTPMGVMIWAVEAC